MSVYPRPTYGPVAVNRVERLGEKTILQFFKAINPASLKAIAKSLPAVPGFRPGTAATLDRQLQTLAQKVAQGRSGKAFARSKEEIGLYAIWRAWSHGRLLPAKATHTLFEVLEHEHSDEDGDLQSKAMTNALVAYVTAGEVGQEDLLQFVTMSPFSEIAEMLAIAGRAKTADEILEAAVLRELPTRLQKDERALHDLESRLSTIEKYIKENAATARVDDRITSLQSEFRDFELAIAREVKRADALREAIDTVKSEVSGKFEKLKGLDVAFSQREKEITSALRKTEVRLDDVENNVLGILDFETRLTSLEALAKGDTAPVPASANFVQWPFKLVAAGSNQGQQLDSVEAILDALKTALIGEGLTKSSAELFAQELLATISVRQAIFLKGAFAREAAAACTRAIAGSAVARIPIALGSSEPWAGSIDSFWKHPSLENKAAIAIVVENVNCAAMAASFDAIAELLVGRSDDGRPAIYVFATLIDTLAAFPVEKLYMHLGPVFDLDAMEWRPKRSKLLVRGDVSTKGVSAVSGLMPSRSIDLEESRRLCAKAVGRRDPRFELNVDEAFGALNRLRGESADTTAIQSLCFGWLMPYWLLRRPSHQDMEAEFDGGRCDGSKPDARLKRAMDEYRSISGDDR